MPKELKKITEAIVKNYRPDKIILFGSRVWGKPKPWSDYDLFILKKYAKKRPYLRTCDVLEILNESHLRQPVDPVVFNSLELEDRLETGSQFFNDIVNKGKTLYERN